MSPSYVPSTVLDPRTVLFTLQMILQRECCYTHLLEEEAGAQGDHCNLPKAIGTVSRP